MPKDVRRELVISWKEYVDSLLERYRKEQLERTHAVHGGVVPLSTPHPVLPVATFQGFIAYLDNQPKQDGGEDDNHQ